jgi:hypothetical protein
MFEIIIGVLGIITSAIYIGFLAYKIHSVALWVIVVATYVLATRELLLEAREAANRSKRSGSARNG